MALRKVAPTFFRRPADDEAAFEQLYERHVEGVYRYALGMLGDAADAEDVTQTTFLNAYRAFKNGTRPDKPQSWLIAIAHNVCRQRFRQAQRRPREVAFDDGIGEAEAVEPAGPTAEELRRALSQLPPNQRAALVMRELEGSSYSEIAGVLGISVSALETLLFRARRSLREQLEEHISCQQAALAINRQLDGRLSLGDRRALRAHLRACEECHSLAQSQRAQRRALKSLVLVPLPLTIAHWSGAQSASAATGVGGLAAVGATTGGAGMSSVVLGGAGVAAKVAAVVVAGVVVGGGTYEGVHAARAVRGAHAAAPVPRAQRTSLARLTTSELAARTVTVARARAQAAHANLSAHAAKPRHRSAAAAHRAARHAKPVKASSAPHLAGVRPHEEAGAGSNSAAPARNASSRSGANPQALSNPRAAAISQARAHSQAASHSNAAAHEQASNRPHAAQTASPDAAPGNSATAPGRSNTPPANSGSAPGRSDTPPGNSGDPSVHSDPPGNSGRAPVQAGDQQTPATTTPAPSQGNAGGSNGK